MSPTYHPLTELVTVGLILSNSECTDLSNTRPNKECLGTNVLLRKETIQIRNHRAALVFCTLYDGEKSQYNN